MSADMSTVLGGILFVMLFVFTLLIHYMTKLQHEVRSLQNDAIWDATNLELVIKIGNDYQQQYYAMRNGNKWFNMLSDARLEIDRLAKINGMLYRTIPREVIETAKVLKELG